MTERASSKAIGKAAEPDDASRHTHTVQFYREDKFLLDCLGQFIGSALGAGDAAVVIATEDHRRQLAERLSDCGLDLGRAVEQGRYVAVDATELLSAFMRNGWPDEALFVECVGEIITRAKSAARTENGRAPLFGEMVALLWQQGNSEAALRLEQLWNQIAQSHSFSLLCAYPLRDFYREKDTETFLQICNQHAAVIPAESYTLASEDDRRRRIAEWQQKAQAMDAGRPDRLEASVAAARLAAIVESSEDAIISKDLNGIVTSWNSAAERVFGWKPQEMIGRSILIIIPPELHTDEDMILDRIRRGIRIEHFETVRVTKDGKRIDVSLTISPIKDAGGKIIGAAKVARDITQQKRAQDALRQAEKLAVTGRMAATIAHEINNPLEAVTNLLYLLRAEVSEPQALEHLALADAELSRVARITRQTLAFYRESVSPEPVALHELLDNIAGMFASRIATKRIKVVRDYQPCVIRGLKGELRQMFSNLLDNAIDAAPFSGEIRLSVRPEASKGVVSIADNGPGVAPENLPRLFEPFFTTKQIGTGLGLWVAQDIAGKHAGNITVQSPAMGMDAGTTFVVVLAGAAEKSRPVPTAA